MPSTKPTRGAKPTTLRKDLLHDTVTRNIMRPRGFYLQQWTDGHPSVPFHLDAATYPDTNLGTLQVLPNEILEQVFEEVTPRGASYAHYDDSDRIGGYRMVSKAFAARINERSVISSDFIFEIDGDENIVRNITEGTFSYLSDTNAFVPEAFVGDTHLTEMPWYRFNTIRVRVLAPRFKSTASILRIRRLIRQLAYFFQCLKSDPHQRETHVPTVVIDIIEQSDRSWITPPTDKYLHARLATTLNLDVGQNFEIVLGEPHKTKDKYHENLSDLEAAISPIYAFTKSDTVEIKFPPSIKDILSWHTKTIVVGDYSDVRRNSPDLIVVPTQYHLMAAKEARQTRKPTRPLFTTIRDANNGAQLAPAYWCGLKSVFDDFLVPLLPDLDLGAPGAFAESYKIYRRRVSAELWLQVIEHAVNCALDNDPSDEADVGRKERAVYHDINLNGYVVTDMSETPLPTMPEPSEEAYTEALGTIDSRTKKPRARVWSEYEYNRTEVDDQGRTMQERAFAEYLKRKQAYENRARHTIRDLVDMMMQSGPAEILNWEPTLSPAWTQAMAKADHDRSLAFIIVREKLVSSNILCPEEKWTGIRGLPMVSDLVPEVDFNAQ